MKKIVYLSLGSNQGNRAKNLRAAIEGLRELGGVAALSWFYETEPVGEEAKGQPLFINCAVALETELLPRQLLHAALALERGLGRRHPRGQKKSAARTIDIDIVLFGSTVMATPELVIPHPLMHARRFVLEPLAEIAPEARHPVLRKTVRELREALGAGGGAVRRLSPPRSRRTPRN